VAVGLVDQVSTGAMLPWAEVELARNDTTPAVCACATPAAKRIATVNGAVNFTPMMAPDETNEGTQWWHDSRAAIRSPISAVSAALIFWRTHATERE
jgi:hypothetical protein